MKYKLLLLFLFLFILSCSEAVLENTKPPNPPSVTLSDSSTGVLNVYSNEEAYTNAPSVNLMVTNCKDIDNILISEEMKLPLKNDKFWRPCNQNEKYSLKFSNLTTQGERYIYVWSKNKFNYISKTATKLSVIYDSIAPQITITKPEKISVESNSLNLIWNLIEQNVTKDLHFDFEYTEDGTSWLPIGLFFIKDLIKNNKQRDFNIDWKDLPLLNTINAKVRISFTDAAGNPATFNSDDFIVDNIPRPDAPNVDIVSVPSDTDKTLTVVSRAEAYTNAQTVNLQAQNCVDGFKILATEKTDPSQPTKPKKPLPNDPNWKKCSDLYPYPFQIQTNTNEIKTLYVFAMQAKKVISDNYTTLEVRYDDLAPDLTFKSFLPNNISAFTSLIDNDPVTITINITELSIPSITGLPITIEYFNGNIWNKISPVPSNVLAKGDFTFNFNVPILSILNARLRISLTDAAGNPETLESGDFIISKKVPQISILKLTNESGDEITNTAMPGISYILEVPSDEKDITHKCLLSQEISKPIPSQPSLDSKCWDDINNGQKHLNLEAMPTGGKRVYAWVKNIKDRISEVKYADINLDFAAPPKLSIEKTGCTSGSICWSCSFGDDSNPLANNPVRITSFDFNDDGTEKEIVKDLPAIASFSLTDNGITMPADRAVRFLVYCTSKAGVVSNRYTQYVNTKSSTQAQNNLRASHHNFRSLAAPQTENSEAWEVYLGDVSNNFRNINGLLGNFVSTSSGAQHNLAVDKYGNIYIVRDLEIMKVDAVTGTLTTFAQLNWPTIIGMDKTKSFMLVYECYIYDPDPTVDCLHNTYKIPIEGTWDRASALWNTKITINNGYWGGRHSAMYGNNGYLVFIEGAGDNLGAVLKKVDLNVKNAEPEIIHGFMNQCLDNNTNYSFPVDATTVPMRGIKNLISSYNQILCPLFTESTLIANEDLTEILIKFGAYGALGNGSENTSFYKLKFSDIEKKYFVVMDGIKDSYDVIFKDELKKTIYINWSLAATIADDGKKYTLFLGNNAKIIINRLHFSWEEDIFNKLKNEYKTDLIKESPYGEVVAQATFIPLYTGELQIPNVRSATSFGGSFYIEGDNGAIYKVFKDQGNWKYLRIAGLDIDTAGNGVNKGSDVLLRNPVDLNYRSISSPVENFLMIHSFDSNPKKVVYTGDSENPLNILTFNFYKYGAIENMGWGSDGRGSSLNTKNVWNLSGDGKSMIFRVDWCGAARVKTYPLNQDTNEIAISPEIYYNFGIEDGANDPSVHVPYPTTLIDDFIKGYTFQGGKIYFDSQVYSAERFAIANGNFYFATINFYDSLHAMPLVFEKANGGDRKIRAIAGQAGPSNYIQPESGLAKDAGLQRVHHFQTIPPSVGETKENIVFWDGQYLRKINLNDNPYTISLIADLGEAQFTDGTKPLGLGGIYDMNVNYTNDAIYDKAGNFVYLVVYDGNVLKVNLTDNTIKKYDLERAKLGGYPRIALTPDGLLYLQTNYQRVIRLFEN